MVIKMKKQLTGVAFLAVAVLIWGSTFVAQSGYQRGGTWDGTVKNLRFGWSQVYCYKDGSPATGLLCDMGAEGIGLDDLHNFSSLDGRIYTLF